ncbi:MAG: monofunctional biosynthetic peptidoglycan transglycosylase [Hyphomicrobiales bacterium]|nr:monofunctional biosynthetic peptidoglycan transglycosylase [Hyphomicrobiales bacterium]
MAPDGSRLAAARELRGDEVGRYARRILQAAALVVALFLALALAGRVARPLSTLMLWRYATGQPVKREWTSLERMSPFLMRAVIASEDAQFCRHDGVDWQAVGDVLEQSDEDGPSRGASTIPMQVARNLFLWQGRSYVRKGLEIPIAMTLSALWPKRRMLEVYLNIAEWGPGGIFGAQAAARAYFGTPAAALDPREAALLASALPNPLRRNPGRPSALHLRLAQRLAGKAASPGLPLDCLAR